MTAVCDVTSEESVERALDTAKSAFGPIDVVVNNAGISIVKPALDMELANWRNVIDTNLNGVWIVAQRGAKAMVAAGVSGSIINIASVIGLRTFAGVAPYAASKLGVIALTRNLAIRTRRPRDPGPRRPFRRSVHGDRHGPHCRSDVGRARRPHRCRGAGFRCGGICCPDVFVTRGEGFIVNCGKEAAA